MPVVFIYLIKIIVCSAVLLGYYWFALRNKIYHQYNRFYLLASVAVSLIVPFIQFDFIHYGDQAADNTIRLLRVVSSGNEYLDEIIVSSREKNIDGTQLALLAYILVSIVLLGAMLNAVLHILKLYKSHSHETIQNIRVINTTAKGTPFSFFNFIFWNTHIDMHSDAGRQVLRHEMIHVKEKHSLDKLFINTIIGLLWINPVFWLVRKELNMIHEFIADKKALEDGDTAKLAQMILQATYPQQNFSITNHFFYSPIKRRLAMITKNHNSKAGYIARVLALPLLLLIVSAFTVKTKMFTKLPATSYDGDAITVVIDAGHGGKDFGATFKGKYEKDLTLAIVKKIKDLNTDDKIKVILSRENDDVYISPPERVEFTKKSNADCFVSVHINMIDHESPAKTGLIVYTSGENQKIKESQLLASAVINQFTDNYPLPVSPNPFQSKKGIWVLKANDCPSVLIEAGFLDNKKDLAFLTSEEGQKSIAMNILAAIEKYAANRNAPSSVAQTDTTTISFHAANVIIKDANNGMIAIEGKVTTDQIKNILIIADGKRMDATSLLNKTLQAKTAVMYNKNNSEAIRKFGNEAAKGVIILKNVHIENNKASNNQTNLKVDEATIIGLETKTYNLNSTIAALDASEKIPVIKKDEFGRAVVTRENKEQRNSLFTGNVTVRTVQGNADTTNPKPLYIVDGVEKDEDALKEVASESIEKIDVLKNESATNIYGQKGKDGVIIITTKKGVSNKASETSPANEVKGNLNVETIFKKVENEASFPGGLEGWRQYLKKNLDGTIPSKEGWKKGKYNVLIQFVVDKDGSINDVKALDYETSKTALHCISLIKNGPKWNPAVQNGQVVKSFRKQPITFVVE